MDPHPPRRPIAARLGRFFRLATGPLLITLPLTLSLGPANQGIAERRPVEDGITRGPVVIGVSVRNARQLAWVLDQIWESWASPPDRIPNVGPVRFPPDMASLPLKTRKRVFVRSVLPHVLAENERILRQRKALELALERASRGERLAEFQTLVTLRLARIYRVALTPKDLAQDPIRVLKSLLQRVDAVPVSLALAQAAVESAWGTSRFVREGNSLFGQWVFSSTKGIAPKKRPEGARYAVAAFPDLAASVRGYMRNLNTLWAYASFRNIRQRLRQEGEPLSGMELAQGLLLYSIRREAYVEELVRVIRQNRFDRFEDARLVPVPEEAVQRLVDRFRVLASSEGIPLPDA